MTKNRRVEATPWQPRMDRDLDFNPFANPRDLGLETPPPLQLSETEVDESLQDSDDAAAEGVGR
jgi:hypothetical protein